MNNPTSMKPLKRLAYHSTATCANEATTYGKCIVATYTDVKKDVCKDEFAKFAQCLRRAVGGHIWLLLTRTKESR
ncbi:hypothetical protein F5887DRAFT_1133133 [Amanita rubescens]|nr:hypothetical protein F5887DRAFT_1133133 [Amanita rubescens]